MSLGTLLVVAAVLLGCIIQRTSGMGVGLVVSPALVLLIGPASGVLLTNIVAVISALLMAIAVRADIDWKRYKQISPVVLLGSVPAALLVKTAGPGWLETIIGLVLLVAVGGTTMLPTLPLMPNRPAGIGVGIIGGFLNTAVGVTSPAYLVYAKATAWEYRSFAATLQPLFATMGVISIVIKIFVGMGPAAAMPSWPLILVTVGAVPVGVTLGGLVAGKFPTAAARRLGVTIVLLGAGSTTVRGILQLLGFW